MVGNALRSFKIGGPWTCGGDQRGSTLSSVLIAIAAALGTLWHHAISHINAWVAGLNPP
jgi:hypothetical protein